MLITNAWRQFWSRERSGLPDTSPR